VDIPQVQSSVIKAREPGAFSAGDIERRRKQLVNFLAACSAGAGLFYTVYYILRGASSLLEPVFIVIASSSVLFSLVLALSMYSSRMASVYFIAITFFLLIFVSLESGRNDGTHYFLFVVGPVMPLLFGTQKPILHLTLAAVAACAFLALEYTLPMYIYHNRPWFPQLRNPFTESLDIDADDVIFIITIFILKGLLTSSTLLAMRLAEQAEAALAREYARSEALLQNLLPPVIARRLKDSPEEIIADEFASVTVLFADIVGFTSRASRDKPEDIVRFLEQVFGEFDNLTKRHGLEKIKTIGDAYMVAGMPNASKDHARAIADMALDMIDAVGRLSTDLDDDVAIRVGFHTGPVIAGVIGRQKPFYDIWGDTINVAQRMEALGMPGRIQTTAETAMLLSNEYVFEERGSIEVKGKGPMPLYFLIGRKGPEQG
jgi:adenylate cyclase